MKSKGRGGAQELQEIKGIRKGLDDSEEFFGIQGQTFSEAVERGFGYTEMLTEGSDRRKAPSEPGIKKRDDKGEGEGGMRDKDGEEKRVRLMAGSAFKRTYGNPMTKDRVLVIGDKIPVIRAIEGEGRGRRATGRTGRERGGEMLFKKGIKSKVIKMF